MRSALLLLLLAMLVACGSGDTQQTDACDVETTCVDGHSCLAGVCVRDGSLVEDETCILDQQCAEGLMCVDFVCTAACAPANAVGDCEEGTWCKPRQEADLSAGLCVAATCDPSQARLCAGGGSCAAWGREVGDCMPSCTYSFIGDAFSDSCEAGASSGLGCHPFGLNLVPVCLRRGGEAAPEMGEPGCDPLTNPCKAGAICVSAVCRRLCRPIQADPCAPGETCVQLGEWIDFHYCRAD